MFEQIEDGSTVTNLMKRLKLIDLVVNVCVFKVPFSATGIRIGNAIDGISVGDKPATSLHYRQHFSTQRPKLIWIKQSSKKQIPVILKTGIHRYWIVPDFVRRYEFSNGQYFPLS